MGVSGGVSTNAGEAVGAARGDVKVVVSGV
jgi:hypothetical protein